MRRAFTLIELMLSISILSVMMLYLYQSYASLNSSNDIIKKELKAIVSIQELKRVLFLDFSLALNKSIVIQAKDVDEDFVFFQGTHSLHKRYNPYIAYIVKNDTLYRLESLEPFSSYEFSAESMFDVDVIGEVEVFRIYKSQNTQGEEYLIDVDFKHQENLMLKVNVLNET